METRSNRDSEDNDNTRTKTWIRPLFFISLFYGENSDIKGYNYHLSLFL